MFACRLYPFVLVLALFIAACGDDSGEPSSPKTTTTPAQTQSAGSEQELADAFKQCFSLEGYEVRQPATGDRDEETLLVNVLRGRGFPNLVGVNVVESGSIVASAIVVYFKDDAEAQKSLGEVSGLTSEVPPEVRGRALVYYPEADEAPTVRPAVEKCVS